MENTHIENDSNRLPEVDVSLSMSSEMTQCNVGLNSCLEKKKRKRKNQKRRYNSLSRNDRDDNHPEGTLIDITPVQMDLHSPVNTCLSADLELTPHDAEVILSQEMDKGKEQNKRHNALKSSDTNQELQEHSSWPTHSSTNFKHVEREEDNYISEIAEQLKGFPRCMDASSIKKHDDHAQVDIVSLEVSRNKTQQKKKRVKSNRRKKRKFTDSVTSSLGSIKHVAGFSELVAQDSSVRDTSLNHSDEAPASGYSEKTLGEVVAAHAASLLVAGDILTGKASGECPDGELASGKREKKIKMEHCKEIINEQNGVKGVSGEDPLGKKLEQGNRDKLNVFHNVVQDVYSAKERFDKSLHKEDKPSDDASGSHSSVEKLESDNLEIDPKMKDAISSSSQLGAMTNDVSLAVISKDGPQQMLQSSLGGAATGNFRKKLLVLDVNGLLADIVLYASEGYKPDTVISKKAVFKRPFCDEFLQFCFERFHVGVWSSRTKRNVESVLDFLMGKSKCNLLFCWDQSHCTDTGFNTIENRHKPLLLKELKKLWEKHRPDLPWEKGEYNESNTLLLDDSPYKALRNPLHTAIFPYTYQYKDIKDNSLGPNGDLRVYLERLASANNVQKYVEMNPFGQRPITDANISWDFYLKVIGATSSQQEEDANSSSAS